MGQLILPPNYLDITGPVVFLAGPIQGADWQNSAIEYLQKHAPQLNIACPRRDYPKGEFIYEKQVDWETYYLRYAAQNGAIMFWLAKELIHSCDRAYAQTSIDLKKKKTGKEKLSEKEKAWKISKK